MVEIDLARIGGARQKFTPMITESFHTFIPSANYFDLCKIVGMDIENNSASDDLSCSLHSVSITILVVLKLVNVQFVMKTLKLPLTQIGSDFMCLFINDVHYVID